MAGLGNILAALAGGGQGVTQSLVNNAQQMQNQENDPSNFAAVLPIIANSYGGQSGATPAQPVFSNQPAGGSIMQPGQPSVPMQKPPVVAAVPVPPPPNPIAAPVNQQANAAQTNVDNSSLAALVPLLRNPQFQALSPIQKKLAVQLTMQMQQQQAVQQRQALQDKLTQARIGEAESDEKYRETHGGEHAPTTRAPKSGGGQKWSAATQKYLDSQVTAAQKAYDASGGWTGFGKDEKLKAGIASAKKEADDYRKLMKKSIASDSGESSEPSSEWSIEPAEE